MKKIALLLVVALAGCTNDIVLDPSIMLNYVNDVRTVIVINEVLSKGSSFKDYIELYNMSDYPYRMRAGRWYATDTIGDETKFQIPETTIPAKGYLVLWGSDYTGNGIALTFNLSAPEDAAIYYREDNGDYTLVDSYTWTSHIEDNALGRYPDGGATKYTDLTPTPGSVNSQ